MASTLVCSTNEQKSFARKINPIYDFTFANELSLDYSLISESKTSGKCESTTIRYPKPDYCVLSMASDYVNRSLKYFKYVNILSK